MPDELLATGLPIIEDCAYALGSRLTGSGIGLQGDYAIYSIPKYYPLPFGGWLVSRTHLGSKVKCREISDQGRIFLDDCVRTYDASCDQWNQARRDNWRFFEEKMAVREIEPYFDVGEREVPGVFVLRLPVKYSNSGGNIKKRLVSAGVESTEYYGQYGFYFPVHQYLSDFDREYICHHFTKGLSD